MTGNDGASVARPFVVVLKGRSSVRIPLDRGAELNVPLPDWGLVNIRVRTAWVDAGFEHPLPRELWFEINLDADSVDQAMDRARAISQAVVPIVAFVANAEIGAVQAHLAFEAHPVEARRDFVEYFIPDERGLVPPSRECDPEVLVEVVAAVLSSSMGKRLPTAIQHYASALSTYQVGGEALTVQNLFLAAEALREPVLAAYLESAGLTEDDLMAREGHDARHHLLAWARREIVFGSDRELFIAAKDVSEGLEHGYLSHAEAQAKAAPVCDGVFGLIRRSIVDLLDLSDAACGDLLERYGSPADTQSLTKRVTGALVGDAADLAADDRGYPILEWNSSLSEFDIGEDGQLQVRFAEKLTVRTADPIAFQLQSYELYGRSIEGREAELLDIELDTHPPSQRRDEAVRLLRSLSGVVASLGPGEDGAEFPEYQSYLLELFYRTKGLFLGCLLLFDKGLPEEALVLGRPLLADALRLWEASGSDEPRRKALAYGWKSDSVSSAENIVASWANYDHREFAHADAADSRRQAILKSATKAGVERTEAFDELRSQLELLDDEDLIKIRELADAIEAGWDIATRSRLRMASTNSLSLHDTSPDSWIYPLAAVFVCRAYMTTATSALELFGWEDESDGLEGFRDQLAAYEASAQANAEEE